MSGIAIDRMYNVIFVWLRHLIHWLLFFYVMTGVVHAAPSPLMWQVEGKSSSARVYLFGSLHYGAENFYPLPDAVLEAFRLSDALAVELDIDELAIEQLQKMLQQEGRYTGNHNLKSQLGNNLWKKLTEICLQLAIDCQQFSQTKPWLAAMQIANLQLARSDYQQSLGLDNYFLTEARNKKSILELETLEEQLQLFSRLSEAEQIQFLDVTLAEYHKGQKSLYKLADAWYQGDEKKLSDLVFSAFRHREIGQTLYRLVFVARNQKMLNAIDEYMESSQKIFLVVGVGHMLGEDGLVALVKQKGYRVTQVDTRLQD
jgi:uncharacterized protein YbaP (TraB family)